MSAGKRDEADLQAGIRRWAADRLGLDVISDVALTRPKAGWSNETLLVSIEYAGGTHRSVFRLPPLVAVHRIVDEQAQAAVHRALVAAGIPAPDVVAVEDDPAWLGAPFLVLEHVHGRALGDVPGLDPWLTESQVDVQARVQSQYVEALADVHRIDWSATDVATLVRVGLDAELDYWDGYVEWASDGDTPSQFIDYLAWCRERMPTSDTSQSLLWGDARFGNVMYDESRTLAALIDWELTSIGPAEMDLGWHLALDELTTRFATVPGFTDRAGFVAAYERRLGRPVEHLDWHEVFALVRAAAVNDREARIATRTDSNYQGTYGNDAFLLREVAKRIAALPG